MGNVNNFIESLSDPVILASFGVLVALLLVWKVFMPLLRPKRMSIHTGVDVQGGSVPSTTWTPEDQKKNELIRQRLAIRSSLTTSLILLGLLAFAVWVFAPDNTLLFVVKFWQPGILFFLGILGWVIAIRRLNTYNSWGDLPYVFSLGLGLFTPILGVVQLFQIFS